MTQLCLIAVDILLCVSVFWMSTYKKQVTWSHELDSWEGNICCSVGIFWMVTRQAVLLCTALWKVVNLCHLGTTSCTYCSLLYVCGIWNSQSVTHTPWMICWWVFFLLVQSQWYVVYILSHSFSFGRHLPVQYSSQSTLFIHLLPNLLLLLNTLYSQVPWGTWEYMPKVAGGHAQYQPSSPLRLADVTTLLLPGAFVTHNSFTH